MSAVTDSCAVCGDRATKLRYSHYGATSCFSCRAFYRRAIEKGSFRNYACSRDGNCAISIKTRKKCPFCRFGKCKRVGMTHSAEKGQRMVGAESPSGAGLVGDPPAQVIVEQGDHRLGQGGGAVNGLNTVMNRFSISTTLKEEPSNPLSCIPWQLKTEYTREDEQLLHSLIHLDRDHSFHIGQSLCEASIIAIKAYIHSAYSQTPLDFTAICWAYTKSIRKLTRFAQNVEDFNALEVHDRKLLLLENLDPMFNIRVGHFFNCDATNLLDQLECLAVFDVSNLKSYIGGWIPEVGPLHWNQFFVTPWANSEQHERKFEGLMSEIKDLGLDKSTATILTVVSLFCPEGTNTFKHPDVVAKMQQKYIGLLFRYLCHTRGRSEAELKFSSFLSMMGNLKEMSDIMKNKTIKWSLSWPQVQDFIDLNEEDIDRNFFEPANRE